MRAHSNQQRARQMQSGKCILIPSLHHACAHVNVASVALHVRGVVNKSVSFNRRRLGTRLRPTFRLYIIFLIKNALWLDTLHALNNKIIDVKWRHPKTAFFGPPPANVGLVSRFAWTIFKNSRLITLAGSLGKIIGRVE